MAAANGIIARQRENVRADRADQPFKVTARQIRPSDSSAEQTVACKNGPFVLFVKANVVHLGDDFFVGRFPYVDLDSGGNVQGLINNIATLIRQIPADAKLIPGHGQVSTLDDLKAYHQIMVETAKIVQDAMKAGKSLDEIKKAGLPEKFKEAGSGFIKTDQWIEIIHKSYSRK